MNLKDSNAFANADKVHPLARLPEEWEQVVQTWGHKPYRGRQVFAWIHRHAVLDAEKMVNLPKILRQQLIEDGLRSPLQVAKVHASSDKTRKLLVRMDDGEQVETVLIPQLKKIDPDVDSLDRMDDLKAGLVSSNVVTQCISSQVGCAMGCTFCASGVAGLKRQMNAGEIIAQVLVARAHLSEEENVRNIVFMGMGEPLHNYDNVARVLRLLSHPDGLNLSNRRVTVSTSGLVPQIDRLGKDFDGRAQLAVSLHAVDDATRSKIMPINRKHNLAELIACLKRYPMPRRRRITIEFTLIAGVNDTVDVADRLVALLRDVPVKVNLIPMNPISGTELGAPDFANVKAFYNRLHSRGITTMIRKQRGDDVAAACGQLAFVGEGPRSKDKKKLKVH